MITKIDIVEKVRVNEISVNYKVKKQKKKQLSPIQRSHVDQWRRMEHVNRI
jgi:hypothetical protein